MPLVPGRSSLSSGAVRVLSVGNMYPPHSLGGYEIVWQAATRALRQAGHDVRVLTTDHRRPGLDAPDEPGVMRDLRWYWRDHAFLEPGLRGSLEIERHNAAVVDSLLHDFRPDVVGWWAMGGMSLSLIERVRRAGIPAVGFVSDAWMSYGPRHDAWLSALARRRLRPVSPLVARLTGIPARVDLGSSARWLFVSETVRALAHRDRGALADDGVLHTGIADRFLAAPAPEREWEGRLVYVGRIDPRKGIATAISALSRLSAATLDVVGDGDAEHARELAQLAAQTGVTDRVRLLPGRPHEEVPGIYAGADAVIFPVEWDEPWGLVPLEAMAVGRPVVATGRGGSGEYLRDAQNCVLFEAGDPASLAAAVDRIAADTSLRARLREGGFATAPRHSESAFNAAVVSELELAGRA